MRMRSRLSAAVAAIALGFAATALPIPSAEAAVQYTFNGIGDKPFSFSFVVPALLTTTTPDLIPAPIDAGWFTVSDVHLVMFNGPVGDAWCFAIAVNGTQAADGGQCGITTGWMAHFLGLTTFGTFNNAECWASPEIGRDCASQLVITDLGRRIPEPGTLALLGVGLAGLALGRRR